MEIADLDEKDIFQLIDLIKETYNENRLYMWFDGEPYFDMLYSLFNTKINFLKAGKGIDKVAREEGKAVGECEVIKISNDDAKIGIIVGKDYRKHGTGKMLVEAALKDAKKIGVKTVIAEVAEENPNALMFFVKNGFVESGRSGIIEKEDGKHKVIELRLDI
jgi:ribosomal protein S18 acetylase RimI-like enzyme